MLGKSSRRTWIEAFSIMFIAQHPRAVRAVSHMNVCVSLSQDNPLAAYMLISKSPASRTQICRLRGYCSPTGCTKCSAQEISSVIFSCMICGHFMVVLQCPKSRQSRETYNQIDGTASCPAAIPLSSFYVRSHIPVP